MENTTLPNKNLLQTKQRQINQTNDLVRSFKATTSLANGLTKERTLIQNDLQKISHGKDQLEALKNTKKVQEPILTAEEKASKVNKAEIKGTGFQMTMVNSLKGKNMIERQRDDRRQRHIYAMNECEKFIDQFYDNFNERKNEIKERVKIFLSASDNEIDELMGGLTDQLLLENEIQYVNGVWEKVGQHRQARKDEVAQLRENLDKLRDFQKKGSGSNLGQIRDNLVEIAFYLEPAVDELMQSKKESEEKKYEDEHEQLDIFYEQIVEDEKQKFDKLYQEWKDAVVRFHLIKQEDAIKRFNDRMNSKEFVNPETRVNIFDEMKEEQTKLYDLRYDLLEELLAQMNVALSDSKNPNRGAENNPGDLTQNFVNGIDDKLRNFNEESELIYDKLVKDLVKDRDNSFEDMDIAIYDLKDFLIKNDARLDEGMTFDIIIDRRAMPIVTRRKLEHETLIKNAVEYQETFDEKMNEICQNVINFYKELATKFDKNKELLKTTEINFQVALAQCGDHHDDILQDQEDQLSKKVEEMRQAIHHVSLNEKLEQCFDLLDQIQRTQRNYNDEYIKIINAHPQTMDTFYRGFESDSMGIYKMFGEDKRETIQALFQKETEDKQAQLEKEAMKKWEEDRKADEAKQAEQQQAQAKDKGKGKAAPAKKGKEADKPVLDVPKLEVPEIQEFDTQMGNKYLKERSLEEIAEKLQQPVPDQDEENKQDGDTGDDTQKVDDQVAATTAKDTNSVLEKAKSSKDESQNQEPTGDGENQDESEKKEAEWVPEKIENDYLEKAVLMPPQDPESNECLVKDLIVAKDKLVEMLQFTLERVLEWLSVEKNLYSKKVAREGKELTDKSVEELDENLRKQWPRKGKLEVEIYQERKSQITGHNKKYERQVRTCLEKYNLMEEHWQLCQEKIVSEFQNFQTKQSNLRTKLPTGKNLAELQGISRKQKDGNQIFQIRCSEFKDELFSLSEDQLDFLKKQNNDMLTACQLFANGGNYSPDEIEWYRGQMEEINDMLMKCKEDRQGKVKELEEEMEKLFQEPEEIFNSEYTTSIENLSAKEGLGKTYGQPRRFAQERLRAEMTKCEMAQKGVDQLLHKLEQLCEKASSYDKAFEYGKEKKSLSIEIRINLVSLIRCIMHYGNHLGGFKGDPKQPQRVSYLEVVDSIELQESEVSVDEARKDEELEHLGSIGFKNANEVYMKFPDAIAKIDSTCKELCTKLYTGDNAKYLVGNDKIPEYLSVFLEHMKRQSDEFRINCVRQLRFAANSLLTLAQTIPKAVFQYISTKFTTIIENLIDSEEYSYEEKKIDDEAQKQEHLRLFRPNLENPANKEETEKLNTKEMQRLETMKELIDDTQLKLLDIEQDQSQQFYQTYLNNVKCLITIFDSLSQNEDFIMLPGDEIVEKKHKNIKLLTASAQNTDLSKRPTRKWPGLGANIFEIDFEKQFAQYNEPKTAEQEQQQQNPATPVQPQIQENEIATEVEVQNSAHHKAIIKNRNDFYNTFKGRFEHSLSHIMNYYDTERKEQHRFHVYWEENLKEITIKHI